MAAHIRTKPSYQERRLLRRAERLWARGEILLGRLTETRLNPLYHLVQLVRHAVFGFEPGADLIHLAVLIGFGLLTWRLAVRWLSGRLID